MIPIVFENPHVCIVNKPPGYLSVPGRFKEDKRPCLGRLLEVQLNTRLWPVHRLDFEVSGIIIFAKNPQSHKKISDAFANQKIKKTYSAISQGEVQMAQNQGEWRCHILRGKKRSYEKPWGDLAITQYQLIEKENNFNRWLLFPLTGRPHQLRYELFRHGSPILGDQLYGSTYEFGKENEIALRAIKIELPPDICQNCDLPSQVFQVSDFEKKN